MIAKKIVLTALSILITSIASAQPAVQWVQLDKKPGDASPGSTNPPVDLFFSPQIIKKGDLATVSVLNNMGTPPQSMSFEIEYDCKKNTFSLIKGISYEGPQATGKADPASSADLQMFANLPATDLMADNQALAMANLLSGVSFGAMKGVACDGKSPADYQKITAASVALAAEARAKAEAELAKIAAAISAITDWAKLGNNDAQSMFGNYDVFYSPSTIKTGDKVAVKVLSNYMKVEKTMRGGTGIEEDLGSTAVELEFDCKQNTFGFLKVAQYAGPKATGKAYVFGAETIPEDQKNKPIAQADSNGSIQSVPGALIGKLRNLVCAASTTATDVNAVYTPEISYVQERPSPIWAEHIGQDKTNYLKETGRTDKTISLEGNGAKYLIDLDAMRVIVSGEKSKKNLNIDEASSELHGWAVGEVNFEGGNFSFVSQEGPVKNWLERKQDGTQRKFIEDDFDEWSVYLKSSDGKTFVQLDLSEKLITYTSADKRSKAVNLPIKNASIVK